MQLTTDLYQLNQWSSFVGVLYSTAQEIKIKKSFGENTFLQNDTRLNFTQLLSTLKNNKEAYALASSAKSNKTLATITAGAGGFLIGWPLGIAIGGGEPNWGLAVVGAGLVVVSFPIMSGYNKKTAKAVRLYNEGISNNAYKPLPIELNFTVNNNSFGLCLQF